MGLRGRVESKFGRGADRGERVEWGRGGREMEGVDQEGGRGGGA